MPKKLARALDKADIVEWCTYCKGHIKGTKANHKPDCPLYGVEAARATAPTYCPLCGQTFSGQHEC